jgi:hypothetical protein
MMPFTRERGTRPTSTVAAAQPAPLVSADSRFPLLLKELSLHVEQHLFARALHSHRKVLNNASALFDGKWKGQFHSATFAYMAARSPLTSFMSKRKANASPCVG